MKRKVLPEQIKEAPDEDEMEVDEEVKERKTEMIGKEDCIFMVDIKAFEDEHK